MMINPSKYRVSQSWRIRLHALPALVVFFYRNLPSISQDGILKLMDVLLECLSDENVEVREMASKVFSGVVRCSQRQSIIPLKVTRSRFFSDCEAHLLISTGCRTASLLWRRRHRCRRGATRATRRRSARCTLRSWASVRCSRACRTRSSRGSHRLRKVSRVPSSVSFVLTLN